MIYYDYLYDFPLSDLATALTSFAALQAAGLLGTGDIPQNMLGDPMDMNGNPIVNGASPAFFGRAGIPAYSYTDMNGNTVNVPAAGDPSRMYTHIRANVDPAQVPFDPTSAPYNLTVSDPTVSAAVLGVWM